MKLSQTKRNDYENYIINESRKLHREGFIDNDVMDNVRNDIKALSDYDITRMYHTWNDCI